MSQAHYQPQAHYQIQIIDGPSLPWVFKDHETAIEFIKIIDKYRMTLDDEKGYDLPSLVINEIEMV